MGHQTTKTEKIGDNEWRVITVDKNGNKSYRIVTDKIDIWCLGNTGLRNPWRIPGGFRVYVESGQVGKLRKPEDQQKLKQLLAEKGEIGGDPEKDTDASITRKYRLMFNKFGFAYPEVFSTSGVLQKEVGQMDDITSAGWRFYKADTVQAQQECFLRGLIVPMQQITKVVSFSPLLWVLQIMLELKRKTNDYTISYIEFATCVQTTSPVNGLETVVCNIINLREERKKAINKKKYDSEAKHNIGIHYLKKEGNIDEYADVNIRILVASGIIKRAGRGITLVPEARTLAKELSKEATSTKHYRDRLRMLCQGAPLPTDNIETANKVLDDLIQELDNYKIPYTIPDIPLDSAKNINIVRSSLRNNIDNYKEEHYADRQRYEWQEIYEYMQLLIVNNGKPKELDDDHIIKVPRDEAAAYLEWILWRSFLAIDHITNKPYEARGFNIDQDFFPIGTAPGGMSDMIFEFNEYVIVVEVTMSTNSRQEAMEGEPVRRHVADYVMKYDKPVYGIFVANKIDSNTAETFRIGVWYNQNDERMALKIVPFTLKQYSELFKFMFMTNTAEPNRVLEVFEKCFDSKKNREAPDWKDEINNIVYETIN